MHGEKSIHEKAPKYATMDLILPVGLRRACRGFWLVVAKGDQNTASEGDQIPTPGNVAVELQKYGLVPQKKHWNGRELYLHHRPELDKVRTSVEP